MIPAIGQRKQAQTPVDVSTVGTDPWLPIDARIYYDLETHNWQMPPKEPPAASSFEESLTLTD